MKQQPRPLRRYQLEGAEWLSKPPPYARGRILADPVGFGKTSQALHACKLRYEQGRSTWDPNSSGCILCFTTALAQGDWKREAGFTWPSLPIDAVGDDEPTNKRKGEGAEGFEKRRSQHMLEALSTKTPNLLLCTYESAGRILDLIEQNSLLLNAVIADEAHKIKKGAKTIRGRVLRPIVARSLWCAPLTGTPIHNKAFDLYELLDLISPNKFGSKWAFARAYFQIEQNRWGSRVGALLDKSGLAAAIAPYLLRRGVKEAYGELPACIRTIHKVVAKTALPKLSKEQIRSLSSVSVESLLRSAALLKLRTAAQLAVDSDEPCVVYAYERAHAAVIAKHVGALGGKAILATGELDAKKRGKVIDQWKAGFADVLVCTLDAVSESATLTRASLMIFADIDWLVGKQLQCEGRIDPSRQPEGERRPARYVYVVTEGPDQVVAERVVEKIGEMQGVVALGEGNLDGYAAMLGKIVGEKESEADVLKDLVSRLVARSERMEEVGV